MTDLCGIGRKQRLVLLNGGLGNQIGQYVFLRWLEIQTGERCVASDEYFYKEEVAHNGYELERVFHVDLRLLSNEIPPQQWNDMIWRYNRKNMGMPQQLRDMGYPVTVIAETNDFQFNGNVIFMNTYDPMLRLANGFLYFYGYWVHNLWFKDIQETMLRELAFPSIPDEKNEKYAEEIHGCKSVCVHVRRGDFVDLKWALPPEVYPQAINAIEQKDTGLTYFVFSDDIAWCRENLQALGLADKDIVYVEGNRGENAYIDMQLMAMCKHRIVSNSSFSYWAALLREERDGLIVSLGTNRQFS